MAQTNARAQRFDAEYTTSLSTKYALNMNFYTLLTQLMGMFRYTGKLDEILIDIIEKPLLSWGYNAAGKDPNDGELYIGSVAWQEIDAYGLPKPGAKATLVTRGGHEFTGVIDESIVIGYNNKARLPELTATMYADFFTETDKSLKTALKKSRVLPIPITHDSKLEKAVRELLKKIDDGETDIVGYDGIIDELVDGRDPITMIELTDPKYTERIQYLSKFYDDMLRRFWTMYGHSLSSGSKMAQVSTMELEGYQTYSRIMPTEMLQCRRDWCQKITDILGFECGVEYNDAWEHLNNPIELTEEVAGNDDQGTMGADGGSDSESETDSDNT